MAELTQLMQNLLAQKDAALSNDKADILEGISPSIYSDFIYNHSTYRNYALWWYMPSFLVRIESTFRGY